ncbi:MAG: copper transporter [Pseudonocardiales bacterium]|nr:MAG: copper transporter [Pseudonocardiales bacterium]
MINFRYHVVSLISVFLALALGIIVGTTQLNGAVLSDLRSQVHGLKNDKQGLEAANRQLTGQLASSDQFASSIAPAVVAGRLTNTKVLVVVAPGASSGVVGGVSKLLHGAGAVVTGTVDLTSDYLDPRRSADLKDFATSGVVPAGFNLPATADSGALAGSLLADVLTTKQGEPDPTQTERQQVLAGFASLSVLRLASRKLDPANFVVVVSTGAATGSNPAQQVHMVVALSSALRTRGLGVVVTGTADSAGPDGVIGAVRSDDHLAGTLSTVDDANTVAGQLSTVLAVSEEKGGKLGHYGTTKSADSPVPSLGQ